MKFYKDAQSVIYDECMVCRKVFSDTKDYPCWYSISENIKKEEAILICNNCIKLDDLAMRVEVELSLKLL